VVSELSIKELPDKRVSAFVPQLVGISLCNYSFGACIEHNNPVGNCENAVELMGNNHHGGTQVSVDGDNEVIQLS
jgi:hypothetical protein